MKHNNVDELVKQLRKDERKRVRLTKEEAIKLYHLEAKVSRLRRKFSFVT